jgi:hypothetical protein
MCNKYVLIYLVNPAEFEYMLRGGGVSLKRKPQWGPTVSTRILQRAMRAPEADKVGGTGWRR